MSTIVETAFETVRLLGLCVLDVFNLVARPIVLWDSLLTPTEDSFKGFGFVSGFIANISVALLCAATGLGCHRLLSKQFVEQFLRMIYFPWVIDAVLQFVAMFGHSVGIPSLQFYPPSFTGFGGLLQLAVAVVVYIPYQWTRTKAWETFFVRAGFLLAAATLVYDATAVTDVWLYKALCYVLAVGYGGFGALYETPLLRQVLDGFDYIMKKIAPIVKTAMAHMWALVQYGWPKLRDFVRDVYNNLPWPFLHKFQRLVIAPAWRAISPLFLPCATSTIVALSFFFHSGFDPSPKGVLMQVGRYMCGATALVSTVVLLVHAYARILRVEVDILSSAKALACFRRCCAFITWPNRVLELFWPLFDRGITKFVKGVEKLFKFAVAAPAISIPAVLVFNYFFFMSPIVAWLSDATMDAAFRVYNKSRTYAVSISSSDNSIEEAADSVATVVVTFITQVAAFVFVGQLLQRLSGLRDAQTGNALDLDALNAIALTMDDPRQCGRCAFGPVDHTGCANLMTHHGEQRQNWTVSNACPRCGWLAGNIDAWHPYDGHTRTPAGRAIFRKRVWGETVVIVRAAAKALVLPFICMRIGGALDLSPTIAAAMALSYLIPWSMENHSAALARNRHQVFVRRGARNRRRRNRRRNRGHGGRGGDNGADGGGADCGAARPNLGPAIEPSQALRNIVEAVPERVFLRADDACSICLEEFSEQAVRIATEEDGQTASILLLNSDPAVVALRCGHALHLPCAERCVAAANHRHVRCPLCREPVSLSGAVGARLFT